MFSREVEGQQERYKAIGAELARLRLPFTTDFAYQHTGIKVAGQQYPLLKMEWVQGEGLITYVTRNLRAPDRLNALADGLSDIVRTLSSHRIAHGDLQHGNILIVNERPILIDYDGMFVPALSGRTGSEIGHSNYQHPGRKTEHFGPALDNFALWVIALSLKALAADPTLWQKHDGGDDCLLLRRKDLAEPDKSAALKDIESSREFLVKHHAGKFRSVLSFGPLDVPPFGLIPAVGPKRPPGPDPTFPSPSTPKVPSTPSPPLKPPVNDEVGGWLKLPPKPADDPDTSSPRPPDEIPPLPPLPRKDNLRLQFDFSPEIDHATLLGAMVGTVAILALSLTTAIHWAGGAVLGSFFIGCIVWLLRFRHRRLAMESVLTLIRAERDLEGLALATASLRDSFQNAINRSERNRARIKREIEQQLEDAASRFRTAHRELTVQRAKRVAAFADQRKTIGRRFDSELVNLRAAFWNSAQELQRQIDEVDSELQQPEAWTMQEADVVEALRRYAVIHADEHYFGRALKDQLIAEGVTTAADVTPSIVQIAEIGPLRGSAVLSWRKSVESKVRSKLANHAPGKAVRDERTSARAKLVAMLEQCKTELSRLTSEIESRRVAELDLLDDLARAEDEAFGTEITRLEVGHDTSSRQLRRQLEELGDVSDSALWKGRISTLDARLRRIEGLRDHANAELRKKGDLLTFWQYLMSL